MSELVERIRSTVRYSAGEHHALDATAQAELVRRGEVAPDELVDAARARIEAVNPALNAIVVAIEPGAVAADDGPFRGVPFLVKDLALDVAGTPLSYGSRWLSGYVSPHDHELVARYRRAGLVIVGKTNTCELGMSPTCEPVLFGATHNPSAPGRSTGGSSGGSAAAVAAGLVAAAHGNDLGGSLRYPAAWCGVFGLKPTRARVPLGPTLGDAVSGLWSDHVITRSVRDSAALLDAVAGPAAGDPYPAPPPPAGGFAAQVGADPARLRIALSTTPRHGQEVDPAWSGAAIAAGRLLEELGHHVDEASPDGLDDPDYDSSRDLVYGGAMAWLVEHGARRVGRPPADGELEPLTRAYWHRARALPAGTYLLALETLHGIARRVAAWFERYDVWLTPTLGGPPPALGELAARDDDPLTGARRFGRYLMFDAELANVTGNPAMSVPFGTDPDGLPVAIHCLGRFGDEATLFRLAAQLEQARPWGGPPAGPTPANPGGHP